MKYSYFNSQKLLEKSKMARGSFNNKFDPKKKV